MRLTHARVRVLQCYGALELKSPSMRLVLVAIAFITAFYERPSYDFPSLPLYIRYSRQFCDILWRVFGAAVTRYLFRLIDSMMTHRFTETHSNRMRNQFSCKHNGYTAIYELAYGR